MKIKLSGKDFDKITIHDLVNGYQDNGEGGVVGYGGKLDIRPAYQREFIYGNKERDAVIKTVRQGFPLNTMYWAMDDEGNFELMDGQQRTISICQYITDIIPIKFDDGHEMAFTNLTSDQQEQILNYELSIYICEGTTSQKLAWFRTINIAGKPLNDQELLNAMHTGPWLSDAKRWFSKTGGAAAKLGDRYVSGTPNRQELLERTLKWISNGNIENYMALHQSDENAAELWQYYQEVIAWVERIFPMYRPMMKGLEWGAFYNTHKHDSLNATDLERGIVELIDDDEVDNKKGIYEYLLTGNERTLALRAFDDKTRVKKYEEQGGICPICQQYFAIGDMEADHITPWSQGGKTEYANCQMLCRDDNRRKSNK